MPRKVCKSPRPKMPNPTPQLLPNWFLIAMLVTVAPGAVAEWLGFLAFLFSLLVSAGGSL